MHGRRYFFIGIAVCAAIGITLGVLSRERATPPSATESPTPEGVGEIPKDTRVFKALALSLGNPQVQASLREQFGINVFENGTLKTMTDAIADLFVAVNGMSESEKHRLFAALRCGDRARDLSAIFDNYVLLSVQSIVGMENRPIVRGRDGVLMEPMEGESDDAENTILAIESKMPGYLRASDRAFIRATAVAPTAE